MITVVEPGYEILTSPEGIEQHIERCGRTCYKSEDRITDMSADRFIRHLIHRGHESVLEHASVTVCITCSRACSHQLVRHRIAAYSQESQRYCDYAKRGLQVICPPRIGVPAGIYCGVEGGEDGAWYIQRQINSSYVDWADVTDRQTRWIIQVEDAYCTYLGELDEGAPPEDARYVLPNATKTEVTTTYNLRQWRHVFQARGLNNHAQWEIRGIFRGLLEEFKEQISSVFEDLT